jgi:hypothetical protein
MSGELCVRISYLNKPVVVCTQHRQLANNSFTRQFLSERYGIGLSYEPFFGRHRAQSNRTNRERVYITPRYASKHFSDALTATVYDCCRAVLIGPARDSFRTRFFLYCVLACLSCHSIHATTFTMSSEYATASRDLSYV